MAKDGIFEALSLAKKKPQITHKIDDGIQNENPRNLILTSIQFVQGNSL